MSLSAGCQSAAPSPDVNASVAALTGISNAIEVKSEGEPVDVDTSTDALTLDEAVTLALRHDPEIQIRLARVRAALADAKQARLLPNPILSVIVRFPEGGGSPQIEAGLAAELLSLVQTPKRTSAAEDSSATTTTIEVRR